MKKIGIYKITNTTDGKVYIGQSVNLNKRIRVHKRHLILGIHNNKHLQNAYNKYGKTSFKYDILEECKTEELDDKEIQYIQTYDSANRDKGYNISSGGQARHDCQEETKKKISIKNTGHRRVMPEDEKKRRSWNWHNTKHEIKPEYIEKANATKKERHSGWGEKNCNSVMTDADAAIILKMLISGIKPLELSKLFNYPLNSIYNLYYGRSYRHINIKGRDTLKEKAKTDFEERIEQAIKLYLSGMPQNKIAHEIHLSRNTLRRELKKRKIDTQLHRNQFV